jgi:hypothetical protein
MQKHQWRQHGVVHFKSRPLPIVGSNSNNNNNNNVETTTTATPSPSASTTPNNENVLYTSLVDHIKLQEKPVEKPSCYVRPLSEMVVAAAATRSPLPSVAHLLSLPVATPVVRSGDQEQAKSLPNSELVYRFSEGNTIRQTLLQSALTTTLPKSISFPSIPSILSTSSSEETPQTICQDYMETCPPHSSPKPIKLRMKFAYQKEQEDNHKREEEERHIQEDEENYDDDCDGIPENLGELKLRSSSTSPIGTETSESRAPAPTDPFQCVGCCVVFAHKPALKAHQICPEDKERPFKCCKCGYKFRQKAHLQKHQWRIHRRRYCDQDEAAASGTTITMQDIINHGVEKSLREIPVYHGKTSSKYYSEILGLEYSGTDDNSSSSTSSNDVQPLDLSPVKKKPEMNPLTIVKIRELEANLLLNQPPLPRPQECETTAGQSTSIPSTSTSSPSISESFPAWKKQRTETEAPPPPTTSTSASTIISTTTHRALPPISLLQKPPVLSLISRKNDGSTYSSYKHSSWIRETSNPAATDLTTSKKSGTQSPEFLREQLSRLQGQNARTV